MTSPEPSQTPNEHLTASPPGQSSSRRPSLHKPRAGVVHELRVLLLEGEHDIAYRPIAVLGDDQVGLARTLGLRLVVLLAVDEHHEVGVLLDCAGLPQIRQDRPLVAASLLDRAAELGYRYDWDVELSGESFEPSADLRDLLDTALHPALMAHQLEVVDDYQSQPSLHLMVQPARLGAHLEHSGLARIVDI